MERVLNLGDLPVGHAAKVQAGGEPICLVRLDEATVKAVHDTCSHQQYSLSEGWVEGNTIECNLHGSAFDLDTGHPESLPAVKPIPVYACEVRDGEVWVDEADQRNDAPVPRH
ncbi:MAG TPA: non-heme iron oxygenase ferredoxin subunit [Egibacteraceae bacterium]|nr:non-heme iron oxygenase ferredoxin subunit [Egibacteraceae bacterium]